MKLGFFLHHFGQEQSRSRGYLNTAFNFYRLLKARDGVEIIDVGLRNFRKKHLRKAKLDAVFSVVPPHRFIAFDHAPNFYLSMWEGPKLPDEFAASLRRSEYHLVPSEFCRTVWEKAGMNAGVVPLGIGDEIVALDPTRQIIRGEGTPRLRFTYVGSNDVRKGWQLIAPAFKLAFENNPAALPHVQMYIKTFNGNQDGIEKPYGDERLIFDFRRLTTAELATEVYATTDVFVFPTFAEGFGLPALEAMAAGCLVIAPETGGLKDFVNANTAVVLPKSGFGEMNYGGTFKTNAPTVDDLARCFAACFKYWGTPATEAIRTTGTKKAREFTWDRSTSILIHTIHEILERRRKGAA